MDTLPREIERKYLLHSFPELPSNAQRIEIEQGWIPGTQLHERIRRTRLESGALRYHRALKFGQGLERIELEEICSEAIFEALFALTLGCRVHKERFLIPEGERVWELDRFLDREGVYLAEVELPSVDTEVTPPHWLAPCILREVTEEPLYTNLSLAR